MHIGSGASGRVRHICFYARTSQAGRLSIKSCSYRLLDKLLSTTEGLSSAVIDYEPHVIAGSLYIELKDTARLDP